MYQPNVLTIKQIIFVALAAIIWALINIMPIFLIVCGILYLFG